MNEERTGETSARALHPTNAPTPFMNVQEAAAFLVVSVRWLRTALKRQPHERGSVPAYRLPTAGHRNHWRFNHEELRAWMHTGCPPVADWRRMQEADRRGKKRS